MSVRLVVPSFPAAAVVLGLLVPAPAHPQGLWTGPQPPCDITPGHHMVNGAVLHLKEAVEAELDSDREHQLGSALEALLRAFQGYAQDDNPGAWYYLGRYYVYRTDGAGADSSFRKAIELAPQCADDIDRYRVEVHAHVLTRALEAWQAQATDSALAQLAVARALQPKDADGYYYAARILAEAGRLDSAAHYVARGDSVAGGGPAFTRQRRSAMLDIARAYEARSAELPAAQQLPPRRMQRDSLERAVARDSTLLARLIAEWAGQPLRPDVQQAVQRDSTVLARRLGAAREALPRVQQAVARDSAAVWTHVDPALDAYERYLEAYPDDARILFTALGLAARAGASDVMRRLIDMAGTMEQVDLDALAQGAITTFGAGMYAETASLLEIGLARNAYHRTALLLVTRSYYALRDRDRCLETARRLVAIDPLNPQSLEAMALALDLAGQRDSARTYLERARSGLGLTVTVAQFLVTETAGVLNGSVSNAGAAALPPSALVFEFLSADGAVVADTTIQIPTLQPGGHSSLSVRVAQAGAVAWRYRKQQ